MKLHEELLALGDEQSEILDGYRVFHDGTVKTATTTESGDRGWYVLAMRIPGVPASIRRFFPKHSDGAFLKVRSLRDVITLREKMLTAVIYARARKELEFSPETVSGQEAAGF